MLTRKDYLMRYIELLGDYLRRRAYGKQDDELDEEVAAALQMRLEELEELSEDWLRSRLSTADEVDPAPPPSTSGTRTRAPDAAERVHPRLTPRVDPWRALMASELALSVGQLRMAEERPLAAAFLFERAATCLDWAMADDLGPAEVRVAKHIADLSLALRSAEVDAGSRAAVMRRAEEAGRFSVVEDLLFDLANDGWEDALTWGEPFYARLGALSPDAVRAGGLDPADLGDDLADLRAQFAAAGPPRGRGLPPEA